MPTLDLTSRRGQAAAFYFRERRKNSFDPTFKLFGTHRFAEADGSFNPGASFPSLQTPITFRIELRRTAATSNGVIFKTGESSRGLILSLLGDQLTLAAGGGSGTDDGIDGVSSSIINQGVRYTIVVALLPSTGEVKVFVNGRVVIDLVTVDQNFGVGWTTSGNGSIGTVDGTANNRLSGLALQDLAGALQISPR